MNLTWLEFSINKWDTSTPRKCQISTNILKCNDEWIWTIYKLVGDHHAREVSNIHIVHIKKWNNGDFFNVFPLWSPMWIRDNGGSHEGGVGGE